MSDATRIANLEGSLADVAAYLDELRAALAGHDSALGSIRLAELERRISPAPSGPGVPTRRTGADSVADTLGNTAPFYGVTNSLLDPTFERLPSYNSTPIAAGPGWTNLSQEWKARYTLDSGTAPYRVYLEGVVPRTADGCGQNSTTAYSFLYNNTGGQITGQITVELSSAPQTAQGLWYAPPHMVGSVKAIAGDQTTTATVGVQVYGQTAGLVADSGMVGVPDESVGPRQISAASDPTLVSPYLDNWWIVVRLTIPYVIPASTTSYGPALSEPMLCQTWTPDPVPFTPAVARWAPNALRGFYTQIAQHEAAGNMGVYDGRWEVISLDGTPAGPSEAGFQFRVQAADADPTNPRLYVGMNGDWSAPGLAMGPGATGPLDLRAYRSGTKTLTIDDTAAGAATLKVIGTRLAPPSSSQTLAAGTALLANAEFVMFTCTGAVTTTAAPTIADGLDGQVLVVLNVGTGTWTIKDQGTLASSNLRLTAATIAIAPRNSVKFVYSATVGDWVQVGPLVAVI